MVPLIQRYPAISDLEARAKKRLPFFAWEYLESGTGADQAVRLNNEALAAIRLVPQLMKGLLEPSVETETDLEGFGAPIGIAPDGKGGVLVTDAELATVFHLDRDGAPLGRFGDGELQRPTGIARNPVTGTIYVTDTVAHDIKLFDGEGKLLRSIGERGREEGTFNYPTHVSFADDRLYVSDSMNFRIQVLNDEGEVEQSFGETGLYLGNLVRPKGVAVGGDGRVYVAESYHDHLLVYDRTGRFLLPIGGTGSAVGQFYQPSGIWTDRQRRVYVADMYNGRVMVFQELTGLDG